VWGGRRKREREREEVRKTLCVCCVVHIQVRAREKSFKVLGIARKTGVQRNTSSQQREKTT